MATSPAIGYCLSSEEHTRQGPGALRCGRRSTTASTDIIVSDHFHPWNDEQGQSPFVWSVLGGLAAVAPRLARHRRHLPHDPHPPGGDRPGRRDHRPDGAAGSSSAWARGENLNEHILGDQWPPTDQRLDMLEEAVEVMRKLWTGDEVTHRGTLLPGRQRPHLHPPRRAAARVRLGVRPQGRRARARDRRRLRHHRTRRRAGRGLPRRGRHRPVIGGAKVCWAESEAAGRRLVHKIGPDQEPFLRFYRDEVIPKLGL